MTDLFGPANAPGAVTARPAETRLFDLLDTWFKDCTSPEADDGTDLQAAFFNGVLAVLRHTARGNGAKAGGAPIVPEDNTDPGVITSAVKYLIQRGLVNFGFDTGGADALAVALAPTMAEYKAGSAPIRVLKGASANATTAPTINVDGLGALPIVSHDGSALEIGELAASSWLTLQYDGGNMRLMSPPVSATQAEVDAGLLAHKFVSPATLRQARQSYFVLNSPGGAGNYLPGGTVTKLTSLTVDSGHYFADPASAITGSQFLCGPKDAGMWIFSGYFDTNLTIFSLQLSIMLAKNGVPFNDVGIGFGLICDPGIETTRMFRVAAGDYVDVRARQTLSLFTPQFAKSGQLFGVRVGN